MTYKISCAHCQHENAVSTRNSQLRLYIEDKTCNHFRLICDSCEETTRQFFSSELLATVVEMSQLDPTIIYTQPNEKLLLSMRKAWGCQDATSESIDSGVSQSATTELTVELQTYHIPLRLEREIQEFAGKLDSHDGFPAGDIRFILDVAPVTDTGFRMNDERYRTLAINPTE